MKDGNLKFYLLILSNVTIVKAINCLNHLSSRVSKHKICVL